MTLDVEIEMDILNMPHTNLLSRYVQTRVSSWNGGDTNNHSTVGAKIIETKAGLQGLTLN